MSDVLEVADRLWRGEISTASFHPVGLGGGFAEVCDGVVFVPSFANVTAFATGDGLVLVDTAAEFVQAETVAPEVLFEHGQFQLSQISYSLCSYPLEIAFWSGSTRMVAAAKLFAFKTQNTISQPPRTNACERIVNHKGK